jgi:hypothetical protein
MSTIDALRQDIEEHGEVHAFVDEGGRDRTIELRRGTTDFDDQRRVVTVEASDADHVVPYENINDWYKPLDFYHHE